MQSVDDAVETLIHLGLSLLQAKVYVSLVKLGTSTGRGTAKEAKVAPQDIYRVLTELQEIGLVEKIIAKPNKYRAMPLAKGFSMLLQRRKNQTKQLEKTVMAISKEFDNSLRGTEKNNIGSFVLIPSEEPIKNKAYELLESAQTSIDLMHDTYESIAYGDLYNLNAKLQKKGVKIRDIVSKSTQTVQVIKAFESLVKRHPTFQVKFLDFAAPAKLIIKDNQEVLMSTSIKSNALLQPFLWSDNPILVQIVQQWYNDMWQKSSEEEMKLHLAKRTINAKIN